MENLSQQKRNFLSSWARLSANWQLAEERRKPLSQEYYDVFKQVGESRFNRAVTSIIQDGVIQFFPTVAEFRGYVPAGDRRQYCSDCKRGWVMVPDYKARESYGNQTAEMAIPCECTGGRERLQRIYARDLP